MKGIEAVIFDWGGVLMRTLDPQPRRALEAQYGLPPGRLESLVFDSPAWARCQVGELTDQAFWTEWGRLYGLPPERTADFRDRFFAGDRLNDELVAFIRTRLRPRCKTALLSNFSTRLRCLVDSLGLSDTFDAVVVSAEEGVAKPEARLYHTACRRLGVRAGQAVFVDDVASNVRGAQQAGLRAIYFTSTAQTIRALQAELGL